MAIAGFLDGMCLALRASGTMATLQNLIPSFLWIAPPRPPLRRNPRRVRDQILPSGNTDPILIAINFMDTRAMASKCVGEEEVGRIFAIFSLISATSSSLVYAAFQAIYRDLANTDRGSYFG